ncbi:MAG: ribonuclease Y [Verrucomicrobiota bacterium]
MIIFADTRLLIEGAICLISGALIGFLVSRWKYQSFRETAEAAGRGIVENARRQAEALQREMRLAANEEAMKLREQAEQVIAARRKEASEQEERLVRWEGQLKQQLDLQTQREQALESQQRLCHDREVAIETRQKDLEVLARQRRDRLEQIAQFSAAEAKAELIQQVQQETAQEATELVRRMLDEAKAQADEKARYVVSVAIQRYAGTQSFESTTATISLPNEEIKGRIIGREGRNIRAFENAAGVTVLIDDTPNAVVLSGFDPVRREIAREAMSRLIQDGRIHPTRIEEVVAKVSQEMQEAILRHGEESVRVTGVGPTAPEIIQQLGRLHYRHSFSQNILHHSIEVAHLMGLMAAELRLDVTAAKRAGLLHDIGKAMDHELEGAHAVVGAEFIKRHGESPRIVNAVASHHGDVPPEGPISALLAAADAISASRPGARSETMAIYLKRVEELERIAMSFPGVEKCFAVQAGRELRVLVQPEEVNDTEAFNLSRKIARRVEEELQYPGQIRVVVMRETRCIEFAK